jgi:hypothetical protein
MRALAPCVPSVNVVSGDDVPERLHLQGAIGQRLREVGEVRPVLTVIKRQRIGSSHAAAGTAGPAACALADVLGGGVVLGLWAVSVSDAVESAPGIALPTCPGTVLPHAEAAQRINPAASRTTRARNIAGRHGDLVRSPIPRRGGRLTVICPTGANGNLPRITRVCRNRLRWRSCVRRSRIAPCLGSQRRMWRRRCRGGGPRPGRRRRG